ncbi:hypothetical protein ACQQ97_05220 [Anaerovoracaceae bacterium SGI.195]
MSNIDKLQQKYNYKIVYKTKDSLDKTEKDFIEDKIKYYMDKFNLEKHSDGAIYKKAGFPENSDFGSVTFTYSFLKDHAEYFDKLEWHDLEDNVVKKAC